MYLCLISPGHWIQQAHLLRWAELVSDLARGKVPPEAVAGRPHVDRETADARIVFDATTELHCVWTKRPIQRSGYHVDHVIPYALWRNNDLWNLLPASNRANRAKSDKLPARELLRKRRPLVLEYWAASREAFPHRFVAEARAQLGAMDPSLEHLFDFLLEAVEVTALQRGCERWAP
jgi:5-methylcytosine-specific restriction endonuclease McrA